MVGNPLRMVRRGLRVRVLRRLQCVDEGIRPERFWHYGASFQFKILQFLTNGDKDSDLSYV